jgi:hypothetical protein
LISGKDQEFFVCINLFSKYEGCLLSLHEVTK